MSGKQPKSAFEMILDWSPARPLWQQDALRRIVAIGSLNDADVTELTSLCLKGQGKPGVELDAIPLTKEERLVRTTAGGAISLHSISNTQNANRLAAGQTLTFGPRGMTIIYGDNGSGKSGYARILKRACRARFSTEVLPDALEPASVKGAKATISYADGGLAMPSITWSDSAISDHILSAVSVFDRESGAVHVREKNEVAFRPFGLDIPDELASACVAVKDRLMAEQKLLNAARDGVFNQPTFKPNTPVGKVLSALKPDTDLAKLKALAELSESEQDRLRRLTEDLARDPLKVAAEQRVWAISLGGLADRVEAVVAAHADGLLTAVLAAANEAREKRAAANLAASVAFRDAVLPEVGGETWRHLWAAARAFSEGAALPEQPFPPSEVGTACVLCHQQLDEAAVKRMIGFEAFITDQTERQAQEAESEADLLVAALLDEPVRITAFSHRRQLAVGAPTVARQILRSLAAARLRRAVVLQAVAAGVTPTLPPSKAAPTAALRESAAEALHYAAELTAAKDATGRALLESERDALLDRAALDVLLPKAEKEIARLADLARIALCLAETNTTAITTLGNAIADEVITPRVRDRFQQEIQKLAASRVRVDIVRSGGKFGSPHYQVRLFANANAKVHLVLSEGEQTCVALALFLTELATASFASTLVFDDPVSSLDHRWRQKVAERLIEEAKVRQIIVFTHDLVFLNDMQVLAARHNVDQIDVSLTTSRTGAGIVNKGLPWAGQKIAQRLDTLEKEARASRLLYDVQDDAGYADAAAKFYNRLRSTWERALEDVAFCNVIQRHRDYINAKDLRKVALLENTDIAAWETGFKICCDITDAHDPARGRNAAMPPPADLLNHVGQLSAWVSSLRDRHKLVN
ncbi:MAG: AAA family ATPase [Parasphingorhabdus sp.]|uniref:AAA family ATPase n=1 Tax=Parasphingorhabdus sp. TaxID=2709688 RepID=UPI0030037DF9